MPHRLRLIGVSSLVLAIGVVAFGQPRPASRPAVRVAHDALRKLGWQVAVPTGTFSDLTVFDAIELFHGFGVHHLELTPGQPFAAGMTTTGAGGVPSPQAAAALLAKLKSAKMDVVSYGPVDLGTDDVTARSVFAFAKAVKARIVIATPRRDDLARLDALATEAGVTLAVRGGPEPYGTPEALRAALAGRSSRVVGCTDTAQWRTAHVDPLVASRLPNTPVGDVRLADAEAVENVLDALKHNGFKGIMTLSPTPGPAAACTDGFVTSMNALSDALTHVAADK